MNPTGAASRPPAGRCFGLERHPLARFAHTHGLTCRDLSGLTGLPLRDVDAHCNGPGGIPPEAALRYEQALGIPLYDLRPDLCPPVTPVPVAPDREARPAAPAEPGRPGAGARSGVPPRPDDGAPLPPAVAALQPHWHTVYRSLPGLVTRRELCAALEGRLRPRTLANLDSLGSGPEGRQQDGGRVVYPRLEAVLWMAGRNRRREEAPAPRGACGGIGDR